MATKHPNFLSFTKFRLSSLAFLILTILIEYTRPEAEGVRSSFGFISGPSQHFNHWASSVALSSWSCALYFEFHGPHAGNTGTRRTGDVVTIRLPWLLFCYLWWRYAHPAWTAGGASSRAHHPSGSVCLRNKDL